jgi:hypothetical protein
LKAGGKGPCQRGRVREGTSRELLGTIQAFELAAIDNAISLYEQQLGGTALN